MDLDRPPAMSWRTYAEFANEFAFSFRLSRCRTFISPRPKFSSAGQILELYQA
jgi:hypothetical protein